MRIGKILVADDDTRIRDLLVKFLREEYETIEAENGDIALELAVSESPDLIILDSFLPPKNGFEVLETMRIDNDTVPIMILSVEGTEKLRITAFEKGADDFVMKPFSPKEIVLRVCAILKRSGLQENIDYNPIIELGSIEVNRDNRKVRVGQEYVNLTPKEFELLYFLMANPNQVYTREELLNTVWNYEIIEDARTVDTHIKRLREKLKDVSKSASQMVATAWGRGYFFDFIIESETDL